MGVTGMKKSRPASRLCLKYSCPTLKYIVKPLCPLRTNSKNSFKVKSSLWNKLDYSDRWARKLPKM
jgi:hypothetical protein